jgi:hypothetical protein
MLRTRKTKQDYETGLEEDRTLKQWGLNAETRGGIEPMGKIFLLTFLFIGLPDCPSGAMCFPVVY